MDKLTLFDYVLKGLVALLSFLGVKLWNHAVKTEKQLAEANNRINMLEVKSGKEIEYLRDLTSQRFEHLEKQIEEIKDMQAEILKRLK